MLHTKRMKSGGHAGWLPLGKMRARLCFLRKKKGVAGFLVLLILGGIICLPVALLFSGSITGAYEMHERLLPMTGADSGYVSWSWLPEFPDF